MDDRLKLYGTAITREELEKLIPGDWRERLQPGDFRAALLAGEEPDEQP